MSMTAFEPRSLIPGTTVSAAFRWLAWTESAHFWLASNACTRPTEC